MMCTETHITMTLYTYGNYVELNTINFKWIY